MLKRACHAMAAVAMMLSGIGNPGWAADTPERVSLIQLMATPEKYDGHLLQVAGYFVFEEENHALYLSPDDAENGISNGGIELISFAGSNSDPHSLRLYDRKYVSLIGVFHSRARSKWPLKAGLGTSVMSFAGVKSVRTPPYRYCPPDCH